MNQAPKYDNMTPSPARLAAIQAEADEHNALVKRSLQPALEATARNYMRVAENKGSDPTDKRKALQWLWERGGDIPIVRVFLKAFDKYYEEKHATVHDRGR